LFVKYGIRIFCHHIKFALLYLKLHKHKNWRLYHHLQDLSANHMDYYMTESAAAAAAVAAYARAILLIF